jgi:hypothetical protein
MCIIIKIISEGVPKNTTRTIPREVAAIGLNTAASKL